MSAVCCNRNGRRDAAVQDAYGSCTRLTAALPHSSLSDPMTGLDLAVSVVFKFVLDSIPAIASNITIRRNNESRYQNIEAHAEGTVEFPSPHSVLPSVNTVVRCVSSASAGTGVWRPYITSSEHILHNCIDLAVNWL